MSAVETRVYRLPPAFYENHVERDLPAGRVVKTLSRSVDVELDREDYDELMSDASYYADHMGVEAVGYFDPWMMAIQRSARATRKRLVEAGPPPPLPADELERRELERAAQAADDRERAERATARARAEHAARVAERDARRALEDAIPTRSLLRVENAGRELEEVPGVSPADASRILDERERGHRGR